MSNWNLVWLQPKAKQHYPIPRQMALRPTVMTQENSLVMSKEEQDKIVENLKRPTRSSQAKQEPVDLKRLHTQSFMENDRHSWKAMKYFNDCHKCMWTDGGTVKRGTKI